MTLHRSLFIIFLLGSLASCGPRSQEPESAASQLSLEVWSALRSGQISEESINLRPFIGEAANTPRKPNPEGSDNYVSYLTGTKGEAVIITPKDQAAGNGLIEGYLATRSTGEEAHMIRWRIKARFNLTAGEPRFASFDSVTPINPPRPVIYEDAKVGEKDKYRPEQSAPRLVK